MDACETKLRDGRNNRFHTQLGKTSGELLDIYMLKVDEFVEKAQKTSKNEQIGFEVKSHALKKALSREIGNKYRPMGNIYSDFKKESDNFVLKKWANRNKTEASKKVNPEEVK